MAGARAAARHVAMVEALGLSGSEAVFEVGCGGGVAATLVGERLTTGSYVGIDRSATQVAAARRRNAQLSFEVATLAAFDAGGRRFDRVFAMHVRALLEPRDDADFVAVRRLLADGGSIHLGWEPFAGVDPSAVGEQQAGVLAAHGFEVVRITIEGRTVVAAGRVR